MLSVMMFLKIVANFLVRGVIASTYSTCCWRVLALFAAVCAVLSTAFDTDLGPITIGFSVAV